MRPRQKPWSSALNIVLPTNEFLSRKRSIRAKTGGRTSIGHWARPSASSYCTPIPNWTGRGAFTRPGVSPRWATGPSGLLPPSGQRRPPEPTCKPADHQGDSRPARKLDPKRSLPDCRMPTTHHQRHFRKHQEDREAHQRHEPGSGEGAQAIYLDRTILARAGRAGLERRECSFDVYFSNAAVSIDDDSASQLGFEFVRKKKSFCSSCVHSIAMRTGAITEWHSGWQNFSSRCARQRMGA